MHHWSAALSVTLFHIVVHTNHSKHFENESAFKEVMGKGVTAAIF